MCKKMVKICSREELVAVQKYFFLSETRKDSNEDCLLDWWEEVPFSGKKLETIYAF